MLDVSVQAQIIDLLKRVNKEYNCAMLFISHDLDVVRHLCQNVSVMERGVVVDSGLTGEVFAHPESEFTKNLIRAAL